MRRVVVMCLVLLAIGAGAGQAEAACAYAFEGAVAGEGVIERAGSRAMTVRWHWAARGVTRLADGRIVHYDSGCAFAERYGRLLSRAEPERVRLQLRGRFRNPSRTCDRRPRRGDVVSFVVLARGIAPAAVSQGRVVSLAVFCAEG